MSELIYSFKDIHKENDIDNDILNKFNSINKLIQTSTQFQDTKKKILNNTYSAKWKNEKCDTNNPITIAYQAMNKLCESNFEDVYKKISNIVFSVTDLEKLTLKLITKIITEKLFIELYIKMIYKLLINHNWIVKNVSFRQILLENIKKLYYENFNYFFT